MITTVHSSKVNYKNFYDITNISVLSTLLKKEYGINDYIPLSTILKTNSIPNSIITWNKKTVQGMKAKIHRGPCTSVKGSEEGGRQSKKRIDSKYGKFTNRR